MTIAELESKIRDRINRGRKQHELLGRSADWNKLCSALDVVGDTELALDSYLKQPDINDTGLCYVHAYGALQLLQVQQDALDHICRALGIKAKKSPKLPHIRKIRNSSVGHPIAQGENKATKSNFIAQNSLTQHGFSLMTVFSDGTPHSEQYVNIPDLVGEQRVVLNAVLNDVLAKMDEAEMKHRAEHRDEKLEDQFPETLSYYFSKIFGAINGSEYFSMGAPFIESITDFLARFRQLLEKRGEWGIHDGVAYHYDLLEYPLAELKAFFTDGAVSELNAKDAYIFCAFIREELKSLQIIAREIDEEYSENPADDL